MKRSSLLGILAALFIASTTTLHAEEGTLSVAPAAVMLRGNEGQSTTQTMRLTNKSSHVMSFRMVAQDVVIRNGGRVFVDAGELKGSIAATAAFSQELVTVAPGETASVEVTVTIPHEPAARAVVALFHGTNEVKSAGLKVTTSLGTLLTFRLSDNVTAEASPLTVTPPTATANLEAQQHLTNSGSEPFVAKAMLAVVNGGGVLVGKQAIPGRRLLPGEQMNVKTSYGGELPAGHYRAIITYDLETQAPVVSTAEFDVR
jgi:hypothetical protein